MSVTLSIPVSFPPSTVVAGVNAKAAKAIDVFNAFADGLPPMPTDTQINALDDLRLEAFELLGDAFVEKLAEEKAALRAKLVDEVATLRDHWRRLEEITGLERWRATGSRSYTAQALSCLAVPTGNGYTKMVMGRELLAALDAAAKRGG